MTAVTVVISFHNSRSTILDAVRSVFAQTHEDWRLILLDDGSNDGAVTMVRRIEDPRVSVVRHEKNLGTPARLNELTGMVSTPYLARMDADDLMHPDRLELSVRKLAASPSASFVCGPAISIDAASNAVGLRPSYLDASVAAHFMRSPFVHGSVTGRTDWFVRHPYTESYRRCQDQELWIRTLEDRVVLGIEEPLLYLREAGTVSADKYATSMQASRRLLREHGRVRLGFAQANSLVALMFAKESAYRVADLLHSTDRIVRQRATPLSGAQAALHAHTIGEIRATRIPGIDQ